MSMTIVKIVSFCVFQVCHVYVLLPYKETSSTKPQQKGKMKNNASDNTHKPTNASGSTSASSSSGNSKIPSFTAEIDGQNVDFYIDILKELDNGKSSSIKKIVVSTTTGGWDLKAKPVLDNYKDAARQLLAGYETSDEEWSGKYTHKLFQWCCCYIVTMSVIAAGTQLLVMDADIFSFRDHYPLIHLLMVLSVSSFTSISYFIVPATRINMTN